MSASGQLHPLAPLLPRSKSQVKLGGKHRELGRFEGENNILFLTGIKP
jgi:hypothetical protein